VLRTFQLEVGYLDEGHSLFSVPDLTLTRGECAAIIGPNGAGKTTFLRLSWSKSDLFRRGYPGSSLRIGYFAQAHEGLVAENSLIEEINSIAPEMRPAEVVATWQNFFLRVMMSSSW